MGARGFLCYLFVAAHTGISWESLSSCDEVRKVYEMKQIGPVKSIPVKPRTGSDLQVCMSRNLTCCTKKMEERYQAAARQDLQNLLQTSSSSLKFLISRNVAAFQETVEALVRQAENHTHAVLLASYGRLAGEAAGGVAELLTDAGLFLLGSELSMDEASRRFFDALFPHVYDRLLRPGLGPISPAYAECLRSARRDLSPFGPAPARLAGRLSRAFLPARVFLQALHLGVEVLNTTDHLPPSRECRRALLRMSYCPHCQGLTASRPCTGYCLNVVRGCLASVAEVDVHWREYVRGLEALSGRMQRGVELEQALLQALPEAVGQAVEHAQRNGPRLSAQVHRACGHPSREQVQSGIGQRGGARDSIPLKGPNRGTEETLSNRRKEFINSLRLYRTFYGGLADQLCVSELASGDGQACWNGADVVKSYTMRVVGSGIRAQSANPEVRVKEADPVINQVIDKLKHINQLLQGRSIPKLGTLDQIETGSGDGEDPYSGDCDDEDGCSGSGDAGVKRTVMRTVSKLTPDQNNRHRYHHPQTDDQGTEGPSASGRASQSASWTLLLMCISTLLSA